MAAKSKMSGGGKRGSGQAKFDQKLVSGAGVGIKTDKMSATTTPYKGISMDSVKHGSSGNLEGQGKKAAMHGTADIKE